MQVLSRTNNALESTKQTHHADAYLTLISLNILKNMGKTPFVIDHGVTLIGKGLVQKLRAPDSLHGAPCIRHGLSPRKLENLKNAG
jgi:hypothetical protein